MSNKSFQCVCCLLLASIFGASSAWAQFTPGLEYYNQPALAAINVLGAYNQGYSGNGVKIGIVDTGINPNHVEFTNAIVAGYDSVTGLSGTSNFSSFLVDHEGHGSHVASIAAARLDGVNRPKNMQGVAFNASLVIGAWADGGDQQVSSSLNYVSNQQVKVINNSWGGGDGSSPATEYAAFVKGAPEIASALSRALDLGAVVVFASGSSRDEGGGAGQNPGTPATFPTFDTAIAAKGGWITVAATNNAGTELTFYSNYCGVSKNYCISAPGGSGFYPLSSNILGADASTTNEYVYMAGTSMAAPLVSGAVALVAEKYPWMTNKNLATTILTTGTTAANPSDTWGRGLLDVGKAINGPGIFEDVFGANVTSPYSSNFSNNISGISGLNKLGAGTLTLSGANTYSGGTTINAGTLRVNNASALGTGAVNNNATLDIGSTTLNIDSTYTQSAASTLMVAVNGTTNGSIVASGTAAANAGYQLAVMNVSNHYIASNTRYKIIQGAAGGHIETPSITVDPLGNTRSTFYATTIGDQLVITSSRAANGFASDARPGDANARAVGNVLDNVNNPTADMSYVLDTMDVLSKSQTSAALDTLVPEVDAGVINTDRAMLNNFTGVSIDRVEKARKEEQSKHSARSGISSGEEHKLDGLWAKGYGSYLRQGLRGGIAGYSAWNAGTALGIDRHLTDAVTLGISGGYAYGNVNSDANSANTTINSAQTTLYGGYQDQKRPFFIDTAVSFAYNWYAGRRNINIGNVILRTANGSYDGQQYGAYLGGGYKFKFEDAIEVTPLVSLQYNYLHINSYNETGANALNLNAGTQNYNQLQSGLGGRIATTLSSQWGKVTPELHSKWLYDFFGDPFEVTSTFNGGGAAFSSNGAKPAVNSFNVGGELRLDLRDEIAITGKIDTQLRQDFSSVYGSVTVRF